jgi:hypothetical protein
MMDNLDEAQAMVRELVDVGVRREDIGFMANDRQAVPSTAHLNEGEGGDHGTLPGAVAGGIGSLTNLGVPEEEAHYYAEGVRRGGILVTVATDDQATPERAVAIMRRHGAIAKARN